MWISLVVLLVFNTFGSAYSTEWSTTPPIPTTSNYPECPTGWALNGNYCYSYKNGVYGYKTWFEAEADCAKQKDGHLVWINSKEENTFVSNLRKSKYNYNSAWIGAHRYCPDEDFVWVNGYPITGKFTNWNGPVSLNGTKACAAFPAYTYGQWDVVDCGTVYSMDFICKAPKDGYKTPVPKGSGKCDFGWCTYDDKCLKVVPNRVVWQLARDSCRHKYYADLTSIHSFEDNNYTLHLMDSIGQAAGDWTGFWIGYEELDSRDGSWRWSDNSPNNFVGWLPTQPDHSNSFGEESCTEMFSSTQTTHPDWKGGWNDNRCDSVRPYVCQKFAKGYKGPTYPPHVVPKGGCPSDWLEYEGRCYRYYGAAEKDHLNFYDANNYCKNVADVKNRADLVSIRNLYEQMFVQSLLIYHNSSVYIGLFTQWSQASWTDESLFAYSNWDGSYSPADGCAYMRGNTGVGRWKWVDKVACNGTTLKLPFICAQDSNPNITATPTPPPSSCPGKMMPYGDACYQFMPALSYWQKAETSCQQIASSPKAHLASINTGMDLAFVASKAHLIGLNEFWIGLNDIAVQGDYVWSDGWPVFLTMWGTNQPDSKPGEDCVKMKLDNKHTGASWYTDQCNSLKAYLCKWDPTPPPTMLIQGSCPKGWSEGSEKCFLINEAAVSFADANVNCMQYGTELASLHSKGEVDFLIYQDAIQVSSAANFWIGLLKTRTGHGYEWTDHSEANFFNWAKGQPINPTGESAFGTTMDTKGFWSLVDEHNEYPYICETPKGAYTETTTLSVSSTTTRSQSNKTSSSTAAPISESSPAPSSKSTATQSQSMTSRSSTQKPTQRSKNPPAGGLSGGAIAGIVIAVIIVVIIFGAVGFLIYTKPYIIFRRDPSRLVTGERSNIRPGNASRDYENM